MSEHIQLNIGATSPTDPGPVIQAAWDAAPEDIKNLAEKILREWIKSRELFRIGDLHAELAARGYVFQEPRAIGYLPTKLRDEGLITIHDVGRDTRPARHSGHQTVWRSLVFRNYVGGRR